MKKTSHLFHCVQDPISFQKNFGCQLEFCAKVSPEGQIQNDRKKHVNWHLSVCNSAVDLLFTYYIRLFGSRNSFYSI